MTKRKIERKIDEMEKASDGGGDGILIVYEQDGEITHSDGTPITEEEYESAGIVIDYVTDGVAETWPENRETET